MDVRGPALLTASLVPRGAAQSPTLLSLATHTLSCCPSAPVRDPWSPASVLSSGAVLSTPWHAAVHGLLPSFHPPRPSHKELEGECCQVRGSSTRVAPEPSPGPLPGASGSTSSGWPPVPPLLLTGCQTWGKHFSEPSLIGKYWELD